jgi:hypothetical protein
MAGNIVQYTSQQDTLRPQEGGAQAFEMEGRRVGAFYHQIASDVGGGLKQVGNAIEGHQTFQEISQLGATGAQLHNALDTKMQALFTDPASANNPAAAQHFISEVVEPALQQYQDAAQTKGGKMFAMEHANQLRSYFGEKAMATQANVEGADFVSNLQVARNNSAFAAFSDPTSADLVRGTYRATVEAAIAAHPGMTADQIAAARTHVNEAMAQITISQGQGMAQANPEQAKAAFKAGGPFANYLDDQQREALDKFADQVTNAKERDQIRQMEASQLAAKLKSEQKAGAYMTAFGTQDVSDPNFTSKANQAILTDPDLLPPTREALTGLAERLFKQKTENPNAAGKDDPATLHSFLGRIGTAQAPTDAEILGKVGVANGLSMEGSRFLLEQLHPKNPESQLDTKLLDAEVDFWRTSTASPSAKMTGMPDAKGKEAFSDAFNYYAPLIRANDAAGISRADTLGPPDQQHPNSIYFHRKIESFNPDNAPGSQHAPPLQKPQGAGGSLLDAVTAAWDNVRAATSGGAEVRTKIDTSHPLPPTGSSAPAPLATMPADRQAKLDGILFGGK